MGSRCCARRARVRRVFALDETRDRFESRFAIDDRHQRFERVGQRRAAARARRVSETRTHQQQRLEAQPLGAGRERLVAHERGLAQGEFALACVRIAFVEFARHHHAEDRVAQELQPLVRTFGQLLFDGALVHESRFQFLEVDVRSDACNQCAQTLPTRLTGHIAAPATPGICRKRRRCCGRRNRTRSRARPRRSPCARRWGRSRAGTRDRETRS